ncbi:MAG: hypothetical protein HYX24_06380 [Candidatus Aenigmarchaeota archaeon]|nr:hypothetical protein [Candidatus Aenigmarchaeota archaeon]
MDKEKLIDIGLGKSEADIYLALLRLGKATVTTLTKETGIHRTYIYDLIEKLREKGLVSQMAEENRQYFQAADPERLKEYLVEKIDAVEKLMPELIKLKEKYKTDVAVEVYKGKEGIKTILSDIIKQGHDFVGIGTIKRFEDIMPLYIEQFVSRMNKKGLKERHIMVDGEKIIEAERGEYRYLPKKYILLSSMLIYGDKVALFIWKEPYIQILINNSDIAKSYLSQFNVLWRMATPN